MKLICWWQNNFKLKAHEKVGDCSNVLNSIQKIYSEIFLSSHTITVHQFERLISVVDCCLIPHPLNNLVWKNSPNYDMISYPPQEQLQLLRFAFSKIDFSHLECPFILRFLFHSYFILPWIFNVDLSFYYVS